MDFRLAKLPKVSSLPNPQDGLRAFVEKAPQAEALAERWMEKSRPVWSVLYGERRRLATAGVVVLTGWLFLHVMSEYTPGRFLCDVRLRSDRI